MTQKSIKAGQKLWFVPVDTIYGPPREIEIYQTGAIWAYFSDEYCEAKISLLTHELEFKEGKIYTDKQSWKDSGEGFSNPAQISLESQRHLRLMRVSEPLAEFEKDQKDLSSRILSSLFFGLTWGSILGLVSAFLMLTLFFTTDQDGNIMELKRLGFNVKNRAYTIFSIVIAIPMSAAIKYNVMPKD